MRYLSGKSFLAARGFLHHLLGEVPHPTRVDGELVSLWNSSDPGEVYWTRTQWLEPFILEFNSISEAAKALRAVQRNWAPYPTRLHRRLALISEALPPVPDKPKVFPFALPQAPMGAYTLLDEHSLLGSARCSSPFPNGEFQFEEDKLGPPSRAYRKIWEALLYADRLPRPGDRCVDLGASPGGWSWALAKLGADVVAVDKAPLADSVLAMKQVTQIRHDAFTLRPEDLGPVDWLCSDIICYPQALYEFIEKWLASGLARRFICTIKMQGEEWDAQATSKFASIPGSKIIHLWHNRHELTWIRTGNGLSS
jgi:23S rRNA (cytidine2498-2'-O)-methyltransferase